MTHISKITMIIRIFKNILAINYYFHCYSYSKGYYQISQNESQRLESLAGFLYIKISHTTMNRKYAVKITATKMMNSHDLKKHSGNICKL